MNKLSYLPILCFIILLGCSGTQTSELDKEIQAIENGLLKGIAVKGEAIQTFSIEERMAHHKVPGASIAIVKDGKLLWAKGYGTANTENGAKVNTETLFQAGSISKPLAALAALKLWEEGKVDLDTDVNTYLEDWKVEENDLMETEKVTLRRLLTHTAGMTVHGFPGYKQNDEFPTIEQVLNGEGNTPRIFVDTQPDSIWRYSGGGYTVMEKVVEDVSGLPLEAYMEKYILGPMNMPRSTYNQPLTEEYHDNASAAYDSQGKIIEGLWHNYPEQAAAGLWTTPSDLATYCIEMQEIIKGKEGILSKQTIEAMLTKHKKDWGLGPSLGWDGDSLHFRHGGKNAGFTNNMMAFAHRGDAIIIMTNADNGGNLIWEIMRGISKYYELGVANLRTVEIAERSPEDLEKFVGKYLFEEKVDDIGDYFVEIVREGKKLVVLDPNNNERDELSPLDDLRFLDLDDGDEMVFEWKEDGIEFRWNNRFQFTKVD